MKASNKEEFMQKLKIWHDENIETYKKFKETVSKAQNGGMEFFTDNVNMLGFNVQEEEEKTEEAGIEYYMPSQLLEKTKAHRREYAERVKQNVLNDDPHTLCMYYFILFENGGTEIAEILAKNSKKFTKTPETDLRNMYDGMISASVRNGIQTKGNWKQFARTTFVEGLKNLIDSVLVTVKGFTGKRSQTRLLKELLIDVDDDIYALIQHYLERRPTDAYIACIMRALEMSGHLSECSYAEFFRSLKMDFPNLNIKSVNRGQELYHAIVQYKNGFGTGASHVGISSNKIAKGYEIAKRMAHKFSQHSL